MLRGNVHKTPDELAQEMGTDRPTIIRTCRRLGVPVYQGRIDMKLYEAALSADEGNTGQVMTPQFAVATA